MLGPGTGCLGSVPLVFGVSFLPVVGWRAATGTPVLRLDRCAGPTTG
ncbi:MAG: hypothetical protein JWQ53_1688 [Klenkia sp.]|nr:hypothetical protein [Klenkia sp.]